MLLDSIALALITTSIFVWIVYLTLIIHRNRCCNGAIFTFQSTIEQPLQCILCHHYIALNKQEARILSDSLTATTLQNQEIVGRRVIRKIRYIDKRKAQLLGILLQQRSVLRRREVIIDGVGVGNFDIGAKNRLDGLKSGFYRILYWSYNM